MSAVWLIGLVVIFVVARTIAVVARRRRASTPLVESRTAGARGFRPINALPSQPHVLLPTGSTIQVTREEGHFVVLRAYVGPGEVPVAVTLHSAVEERPRSAFDTVEVRLDGQRIGILSQIQTANLKPLVEFVAGLGKVPVARAVVVGNAVKADVKLHVAKAQNVPQAWLDDLRGSPVEWEVYRRHAATDDREE